MNITLNLTDTELAMIEKCLLAEKVRIGKYGKNKLDIECKDNVVCQEIEKLELKIVAQALHQEGSYEIQF